MTSLHGGGPFPAAAACDSGASAGDAPRAAKRRCATADHVTRALMMSSLRVTTQLAAPVFFFSSFFLPRQPRLVQVPIATHHGASTTPPPDPAGTTPGGDRRTRSDGAASADAAPGHAPPRATSRRPATLTRGRSPPTGFPGHAAHSWRVECRRDRHGRTTAGGVAGVYAARWRAAGSTRVAYHATTHIWGPTLAECRSERASTGGTERTSVWTA